METTRIKRHDENHFDIERYIVSQEFVGWVVIECNNQNNKGEKKMMFKMEPYELRAAEGLADEAWGMYDRMVDIVYSEREDLTYEQVEKQKPMLHGLADLAGALSEYRRYCYETWQEAGGTSNIKNIKVLSVLQWLRNNIDEGGKIIDDNDDAKKTQEMALPF